jgi:glyoxylase-like metal-dependent hydrolase (beta-lactamase superfamily II)
MQDHLSKRQPIITSPDTAESLRKGNLDPGTDITHVILSHTHWDHIGMPSDYPNAEFIVGSGTLHTVVHGANHYPAAMFEKDPLPLDRTKELPPTPNSPSADIAAPTSHQTQHTWSSISTLPNATDLFSDGSIYLIDAPGHLQGHLNLLARLGPDRWLYLGGDCCHDTRIITGEKEIAEYDDGHGGLRSVHSDLPLARETIVIIREFVEVNEGKVEWVIAHDLGWWEGNQGKFWPGKI